MRMLWLILGVCVLAGCASQQPDHAVWPEMTPVNSMATVPTTPASEAVVPKPTPPPEPAPTVASTPPIEAPVEASGSPATTYDHAVIDTIQHHWHELRGNFSTNSAAREVGKVVIAFRVHSDGRISNVKTVSSNVSGLLTYLCQRAVTDPAPYPRWPSEMLRQLGEENRTIRFTFSYE